MLINMNIISQMYRPIFTWAVFFLLLINNIHGASRSISGIVLDSETNKAIPNAVIRILEISKTFTCNDEGTFSISEVEFGNYTFVLKHIGYKENISKITIDETTR